MTLADLFPDEDFRFHLRFQRRLPAGFFAATTEHDALIAERRRWRLGEPDVYAGLLPPRERLLEATFQFARSWKGFMHPFLQVKADPVARVRLGRALETMPEAMACYKGIASVRSKIICWLVE
jgi:hypothetical protein